MYQRVQVKQILLIIFLLFIICINQNCNHDKDSRANELRIISLSPFITEIIYALGAEKDLVAVTDYCSYPADAQHKIKIGGLLDPNIEKIITLKPTHILGQPAHAKLNQMLGKFGLEVVMMPNEDINDIFSAIKKIGTILNDENQVNNLISSIQDSLKIIKKNINADIADSDLQDNNERKGVPEDSITAMLIVGREKGSLRNITVAGNPTFIGQMWQLVGGKNLYPDLPARYGMVSLESIIIRNPDVIIEFDPNNVKRVIRVKITREWEIFKELDAIKNNNLYLVSGNHAFIPGPRLYLLAQDFSKIIKEVKKGK